MNEINDKNIDKLFSQSLNKPELEFVEAHWLDMKQKLEKAKKRRVIFWWSSVSGAAAALLIALAWWLVLPGTATKNGEVVKAKSPVSAKSYERKDHKSIIFKQLTMNRQSPVRGESTKYAKGNNGTSGKSSITTVPYRRVVLVQKNKRDDQAKQVAINDVLTGLMKPVIRQPDSAPATNATHNDNLTTLVKTDTAGSMPNRDSSEEKVKPVARFKPSLVLSVSAAPDISGVNSLKNERTGFSGGLLLTLSFSKKLSITSGALLAKKVYGTGFNNYKPYSSYSFPSDPLRVDADCRVVDIPLNVNYSVLTINRNSFQLSAGVSSYIMLTEKYTYEYASPLASGPRSYNVRNINKHTFGIANLALAYQRQLSSTTSIGIRPYVKLPLTAIGYGNVRLLSSGVALNLDINISDITRKKP